MKISLEEFTPDSGSSFRFMDNPRLSELFYWHFHPETELVFIEAARGTRHVGEHISSFSEADLVLIGGHIPHLNFDYGIQTPYTQYVLHISEHFLRDSFDKVPELAMLARLFERAAYGLAFGTETQKKVKPQLQRMASLTGFSLFTAVLEVLQLLAEAQDIIPLHSSPAQNQYTKKERQRLGSLYRFIDEQYARKISIEEAASVCCLSKAAFCRYFKKMTQQTFTEFLNHYRVGQAQRLLLMGHSVTDACFASGFESLSYFNRVFKKTTGRNPLAFRHVH